MVKTVILIFSSWVSLMFNQTHLFWELCSFSNTKSWPKSIRIHRPSLFKWPHPAWQHWTVHMLEVRNLLQHLPHSHISNKEVNKRLLWTQTNKCKLQFQWISASRKKLKWASVYLEVLFRPSHMIVWISWAADNMLPAIMHPSLQHPTSTLLHIQTKQHKILQLMMGTLCQDTP